jgi:hypothetical protein
MPQPPGKVNGTIGSAVMMSKRPVSRVLPPATRLLVNLLSSADGAFGALELDDFKGRAAHPGGDPDRIVDK